MANNEKTSPGNRDTQVPRHHFPPSLRHVPLSNSLSHKLRGVSRGLMRSLEARITAHGIPSGGWFLLRVLWDRDDVTQVELSERMGVMGPTTFRAVSSLESLGLVTRVRNESDARCTRVRLTAKGRALEDDLIPHSVEVINMALAGLSRAEVATLQYAIQRMLSNLEADPRLTAPVTPVTPVTPAKPPRTGGRARRKPAGK